jgi:MoaA/NifB/PqqE/SkfB family radical SAM enzyme
MTLLLRCQDYVNNRVTFLDTGNVITTCLKNILLPGFGTRSKIIPRKLRIEASSYCQLRCPSCPNTDGAMQPVVGRGFLKTADFKKLADGNPQILIIELSNCGEIFLNPDLLGIMEFAYRQKILLTADNGVNLNSVKEDVLEGLVKYQFRSMTCAIDGASNDTYKIYRVNGNFEAVIENIKKINKFKEKYRSKYPLLTWQLVVFGHNEHEIPRARMLAGDLKMAFRLKLSWDPDFSPVRNKDFVRKVSGLNAASREEYKERRGVDYMDGICHQLWEQPQINWDGKVLGCCHNFWGDFGGNTFKDGLLKSVNNEKIKYARDMLLGRKVTRADIPCTKCDIYLSRRANNQWLERGISRSLFH